MSTISFSVDEKTKREFARWAKRAKKSQSELFRDLLVESELNAFFRETQKRMEPVLKELGLETEEDIYEYLESDETYTERKQRITKLRAAAKRR
jgi:(p)ppGpp synthase/HD superfamily hydrolase